MSAHKPSFGPVELGLMNNVMAPEVLREHVPGMAEVLDGASHLRAMNEEIGILGKFQQNMPGWTEDRSAFRVAKIDTAMMVMLDHLHEAGCMCGKSIWGADGHKAWFYAWLETDAGKAFDVRSKVALR
jgi:hypothetical protein